MDFANPSLQTQLQVANLKNISFQGAAGYIKFDSNHEAGSSVNIFQIQGGQPVLVGVYNPNEDNLTITDLNLLSTVPADQLKWFMPYSSAVADDNHLLHLWTCVHLDNHHLGVVSLLEK